MAVVKLMELYERRDMARLALYTNEKALQQAADALRKIPASEIVEKEYCETIARMAQDVEAAAQSVVVLENQIRLLSKD